MQRLAADQQVLDVFQQWRVSTGKRQQATQQGRWQERGAHVALRQHIHNLLRLQRWRRDAYRAAGGQHTHAEAATCAEEEWRQQRKTVT